MDLTCTSYRIECSAVRCGAASQPAISRPCSSPLFTHALKPQWPQSGNNNTKCEKPKLIPEIRNTEHGIRHANYTAYLPHRDRIDHDYPKPPVKQQRTILSPLHRADVDRVRWNLEKLIPASIHPVIGRTFTPVRLQSIKQSSNQAIKQSSDQAIEQSKHPDRLPPPVSYSSRRTC